MASLTSSARPISPHHPSARSVPGRPAPGRPPGGGGPRGRPPARTPRRRPHDPYRRRQASAEQAVAFAVVAFLVAALLGSDALVGLARRQELGWPRSVALVSARALDRVADGLSLDRPARAARRALGDDPTRYEVEALLAPQSPSGAGTPDDHPPPTTASARRVPDAYHPLQIYVGGDSMARELGEGLARVTPTDTVTVRDDHRVSSGLARPDFFDWPQRLAQVVVEQRPDVFVLVFGSNDDQAMETPTGVVEVGTTPWLAEYRARVGTVMDLVNQPGTTTVWVGLPVMRSADYDRAVAAIDAVQRQEAAARPWIHYVDGRALFAGPDGGYRQALAAGSGEVVMRQEDGVHWSIDGSNRVGRAAWEKVAPEWGLPLE